MEKAKIIDSTAVYKAGIVTSGGNASLSIIGGGQRYTGETTVTPSDEVQTLATKGYTLTADITINPVPSNYGKIAWNGITLSVY